MKTTFIAPTLELILTKKCNLNCSYCFEKQKNNESIDIDKFIEEFEKVSIPVQVGIFGGEPLIEVNEYTKLLDYLDKNERTKHINKGKNQHHLTRKIVTNGTLIKDNIDIIKKYGVSVQISLDGDKDCQDLNRCYKSGEGSFSSIMKGIELCLENGIDFSIHGVITQNNIKYFFDSFKFILNVLTNKYLYLKHENPLNSAIKDMMKFNFLQLDFEREWLDSDIDSFIEQLHETVDWIYNNNDFDTTQKNNLFLALSISGHDDRGSICGSGTAYNSIDVNFDLYPCHRFIFMDRPDVKEKFNLGKFTDISDKSKKYWNSLYRMGQIYRYSYSSCFDVSDTKNWFWCSWCPSANYEVSGNIYYLHCKYNVLIYEVTRFFQALKKSYFMIEDNHSFIKSEETLYKCGECKDAWCCKSGDYVVINKNEYIELSKISKNVSFDFNINEGKLKILNNKCEFLDINNKCIIYDKSFRPSICKKFVCGKIEKQIGNINHGDTYRQ